MRRLSEVINLWKEVLRLEENIVPEMTEREINRIYNEEDVIKDEIARIRFDLSLEDVQKEQKIVKILFE